MHSSNMQISLKQLILMSWQNRWTEKQWTMHAQAYLRTPSDVFHVADALVSQAYIGTAPNSLLVQYIWYGINSGLFSYASVITAISKHDDLHKVESTRELYKLLSKCFLIVNEHPLIEDSMDLCCSLRVILQWLLTNTEQYLKGVPDIYASTAEELLSLNCQTLKQLTTGFKTSVLLTIARFEESGVWSHIETDLAVIKTSAGQHRLHAEITESCHYVSHLSRSSISPKPINTPKSLHAVSLPISTLLMLEVKLKKFSDSEGIASQLTLIAQIHGFSMSDLLFQIFRSCFLGFIDSVRTDCKLEQDWATMLWLRLPKILSSLKLVIKSDLEVSNEQGPDKFEVDLCNALVRLGTMDNMIACLKELRRDVNWMKILVDVIAKHGLIFDTSSLQELIQLGQSRNEFEREKCQNPLSFLKAAYSIDNFIAALNPAIFTSDCERILKTFEGISPLSHNFNTVMSAAMGSGHISSVVNQLTQLNEFLMTSTGENGKTAEARAVGFDFSFLVLCNLVKQYGKAKIFDINSSKDIDGSKFIRPWFSKWWMESVNICNQSTYEADPSRVDMLIQVLRSAAEFKLILAKWNDLCINLPQSMAELIIAKQKGFLSAADLRRACYSIRDNLPLSVSLAVVAVVSRNARSVFPNYDHINVLQILTTKSQGNSISSPLYEERFAIYEKIAHHFTSDILPSQAVIENGCVMTVSKPAVKILKEAWTTSDEKGWVDSKCLDMFLYAYKYLGIATITRQLVSFITQESRLSSLENAFDLVYSILKMDLQTFTIYLLKTGLQIHFFSEPKLLVPPFGLLLAEMIVACLDSALNDIILKQKSQIFDHVFISSYFYEMPPEKKRSNIKVRRLLSCSTEHDLSASNSSTELSSDDPLLVVFCDFVHNLWDSVNNKKSTPLKDFTFSFVKLCLYSTPLLSRTMKQIMPISMVRGFSDLLVKDSRELLFAACDLGNPEIRRIAAEAICHASNN